MGASGYAVEKAEMDFIARFLASLGGRKLEIEAKDVRQGWGSMVSGAGLLGGELKVKDRVFGWGLAGHADSEIRLISPLPLKSLRGFAGVEANKDTLAMKAKTQVAFSVNAEKSELWTSRPLSLEDEAQSFELTLNGAKELTLLASSETPLQHGHVDWGELLAETESGELVKIGCGEELSPAYALPIDFDFGKETMPEFILRCGLERTDSETDGCKTASFSSFDAESGLRLLFTAKAYGDMPVCEWRTAFENCGKRQTKILRDAKSLCLRASGNSGMPLELLRGEGSYDEPSKRGNPFKDSFLPVLDKIGKAGEVEFGAKDGRCSDPWLPYFNCKLPFGGGLVFAIGWAGQWTAKVSRSRIEAGLGYLNAKLMPGERISLPSIYMIRYEGEDMLRGNKLLRRFMREKIAPRYDGKPIVPPVSSMAWGGMAEPEHLKRIENLKAKRLPVDVYWIDAGWYAPASDSEHDPEWSRHVGNWSFNPETFPNGTKPIAEAANKAGMKFLLWVEPERAIAGTKLPTEHPNWFLGEVRERANLLLNIGNREACDWWIEYVSWLVEKQGVGFYREDFNIRPLPYWRANDAPDRQGITEIKAVEGLYRFWGELRRRFPKLMIDNCSSGGRRLDIELLRHSVPLWASDMQCSPGFNPDYAQTHVSGLSLWLPFFGFGTQNPEGGDTYNFRSNMAAAIGVQLFYQRKWHVSESYPHDWLRKMLEQFHAVKDCFSGDFTPLVEQIDGSPKLWSASQFHRPDLGRGAVTAFRRSDSDFVAASFKLKELERKAVYEVHDFDSGRTWTAKGSELMEDGLKVEMPEPRSSRLIAYKRI